MASMQRYTAKAVTSGEWGESKKKGTPFVEVIFEVQDGPSKGQRFPWQGYITEATRERTLQSLRFCGCTFPGDDPTNLAGINTNMVEIQVEDGDYGPRAAFVNERGRATLNDENKMSASGKKALASMLKGTLLSLKTGVKAAKPAAATTASDPFAVAPTADEAPSNDTGEPLAPTGTDQIPF